MKQTKKKKKKVTEKMRTKKAYSSTGTVIVNIQQQITLVMLYNNNGFCPTPIGGCGTKFIIIKHPCFSCNGQI